MGHPATALRDAVSSSRSYSIYRDRIAAFFHDQPMTLTTIANRLSKCVTSLRFGDPITHIYNPLDYARAGHRQYLKRYGTGPCGVVLLGMNPGPWGMVQTGVPFGEVTIVRDWLGINATIGKPEREHPKRPVLGFDCGRSEVSGARLWGWALEQFKTPKRFFRKFFVANYCPLSFMESTGRNRTPDKLTAEQREPLFEACDLALRQTVEHLKPRIVVGVGAFAERRAQLALADVDVEIGRILHPSPASPAANNDWAGTITKQLSALGVDIC